LGAGHGHDPLENGRGQRVVELSDISGPQGVAFSLQPNTMVRLEMHYLNTTAADVTVQATSTFITIPDADFTDEADFLFIGNPDISIPPMSTETSVRRTSGSRRLSTSPA
jgi:hypothetical protein